MARSGAATNNGLFPGPRREERPGHNKTDQSVRENGAKCDTFGKTSSDRNSNVWSKQSSERRSQSLTSCQPAPNSSFLWKKSNRVASEYQTGVSSTIAEEEEQLYDDVQNCHTYSEIRKRDSYDDLRQSILSKSTENLTESKRASQIYMSAENLTYDDVSNVRTQMIPHHDDEDTTDEESAVNFHHHSDLVTATPAVILEDGALDSLSVIYDDIRRQENNNNNNGREETQEPDQLTLYESIAGSLLRLDKIEVNFQLQRLFLPESHKSRCSFQHQPWSPNKSNCFVVSLEHNFSTN